jgi:hypothetical protein
MLHVLRLIKLGVFIIKSQSGCVAAQSSPGRLPARLSPPSFDPDCVGEFARRCHTVKFLFCRCANGLFAPLRYCKRVVLPSTLLFAVKSHIIEI